MGVCREESGSFEMTHSNLSVEVQGNHIIVFLGAPVSEQDIGSKKLHGSLPMTLGLTIQKPQSPYPSSVASPGWPPTRLLASLDGSRATMNCTRQRSGPWVELPSGSFMVTRRERMSMEYPRYSRALTDLAALHRYLLCGAHADGAGSSGSKI